MNIIIKMDARRRLRKNMIINNIRDIETLIKRNEDTIRRIKYSQMGELYITTHVNKMREVIVEKNILLEKLLKDKSVVDSGGLDEEINKEYDDTKKHTNLCHKENLKAKIEKIEKKKEKKEISQSYWKGILTASRGHRQKDKDMRYCHRYYNKVVDSLPSYMQNNLAEMPNNKGYIWRGVHFYGELNEQTGPRVMFEKKRGGILVIHENTMTEYRRFEKQGKNRKQLVQKYVKKKKQLGVSLMDYVHK
jgi:hypothetical protein